MQGSGVMVGVNNVLTASHVVYSSRNGGAAVSTTVTPAYNEGSKPFGSYPGWRIHYNKVNDSDGMLPAAHVPLDYALISLKTPLGLKTGFYRLAGNHPGGVAHLTGYPSVYQGRMISTKAVASIRPVISGVDCLDIRDFRTSLGASGGPVYQITNGEPYVLGVVSTVNWSAPIADTKSANAYSSVMNFINSDHQYVADALPVMNLPKATVTVAPGASKTHVYRFNQSFSVPIAAGVTVSTRSGSAEAGVDFEPVRGSVRVPAHATEGQVELNLHPDWDAHPGVDRLTFYLKFSNPEAAVFPKSYAESEVEVTMVKGVPGFVASLGRWNKNKLAVY